MSFLSEWRLERDRRRRARVYVDTLAQEPAAEDVAWLDGVTPQHDADHARWELRYARRALGLLVAGRDAVDDRTASLVARELIESLAQDPAIAVGRLPLAERQLNQRLAAYRDALSIRPPDPSGSRLARALFRFADLRDAGDADAAHAGAILNGYMQHANAALRSAFGTVSLPEDVAPSAAQSGQRRG